jgi:CheY-like chemotaxis protein
MRVLIVEDDSFYAQFICELLQDRRITVDSVRNAEDALRADIESFDGAIVDVMLPNDPEMSGISAEESRGGFATGICVARRLLKQNAKLQVVLITSGVVNSESEAWALRNSVPFVGKDEGTAALLRVLDRLGIGGGETTPLAFIVHGHDEVALMQLKDYIQNTLQWREPVVLREQPNAGKTVVEKFEEHAFQVDCVFVLITPDDKAIATGSDEMKRRSRQNVIFEMGFFYGSLGRRSGRILLLHNGPVDLPSDIAGIVWIDISNGVKAAGEQIRNEVRSLVRSV